MSKGSNYKFSQIFGYKGVNQKIQEQDIITAIKFDNSGKYLAIGDKAGRIIIFQTPQNNSKNGDQYDYYAEFQSHNRQFDYLKSMEVQETILSIDWLKAQQRYQKMVTTNSRSIKIWKIFEKADKKVVKSSGKQLNIPKVQLIQSAFVANLQQQFPYKHQGQINGISISNNEQYILSFDQIQGFLWDLQKPKQAFLIADLKKNQKIQDVKENITCGKFHPIADNMFAYGTNKNTLKLCDMRVSSLQKNMALSFQNQTTGPKNFFTEMVSSYSSVEFLKGGKYLASRDFLTVKLWDTANTKKPLFQVSVQQNIKSKLCQMFENDSIFDKFSLAASKDSNTLLTGNYNNCFHLIDTLDGSNTQYQLNYKKNTISRVMTNKQPAITKMDYKNKIMAGDFNKTKNKVAVASQNCFFIYSM